MATKRSLALEAFQHTAQYDAAISHYLSDAFGADPFSGEIAFGGQKIQELRYGENPIRKQHFIVLEFLPAAQWPMPNSCMAKNCPTIIL